MSCLTVNELYEKINALEEIEKIAKDSGLSDMLSGSLNFTNIPKLIKLLKTFKKFGINKDIWRADDYKINRYISIIETDYINNVGKLNDKEELLAINFPTGCYIFGYYYSNEFFTELQEVKPKYIDKLNSKLYYDCSNSKEAYEHYEKTYKKYLKKYDDMVKKEKIKKLEKELDKLKGEEYD